MNRDISHYVMPPRPDWNAIGPRLPRWFLSQLRQVDDMLVAQYIPPAPIMESKLSPLLFPNGVWAICRRMRRTGWLYKRWCWSLAGPDGELLMPTPETIRVLRLSRNLWRCRQADRLDDAFDQSIRAVESAREEDSRDSAIADIEGICRKHDFATWRDKRISTYVRS